MPLSDYHAEYSNEDWYPIQHNETTGALTTVYDPWHITHHPTCNSVHELSIQDAEFLNSEGFSRLSIVLDDNNSTRSHLRMLRMEQNFSPRMHYKTMLDVAVMERLTHSEHIVTPHQYCGQSVVSEYMPWTLRKRIQRKSTPISKRLQFAIDILSALSELHARKIYHMDLQMKNVLVKKGVAVVNDFNLAWMEGAPVKLPVTGVGSVALRPPQLLNPNGTFWQHDPALFDIYSAGNLLFEIWTRQKPYQGEEERMTFEQIADRKRRGLLPFVTIRQSNLTEVRALELATRACFRMNHTAEELSARLKWVQQQLMSNNAVSDHQLERFFGEHPKG